MKIDYSSIDYWSQGNENIIRSGGQAAVFGNHDGAETASRRNGARAIQCGSLYRHPSDQVQNGCQKMKQLLSELRMPASF